MAGTLRVPRSRGAFSGVLLILLGVWGGLVPLVGPYLHYAYTPDKAWTVTSGRVWLEFLPAAGVVVGGLMVLASKLRPWAITGASLAAVSGGWFALGSVVTHLWMRPPLAQGTPVGGTIARAVEQIGFFTGLGAVIICVAALVLGRLSLTSARDIRIAERAAKARLDATMASRSRAGTTARSTADTDTGVTTPIGRSSATSSPTASAATRKTPMAALTRIASRNKSEGTGTSDTDNELATDRVGAGTDRS